MEFAIEDFPEVKEFLIEKLDSKNWWMFVLFDPNALNLIGDIEDEFYSVEKNKYFEMMLPPGFLNNGFIPTVVILCRKKEMTRQQLSSFLGEEVLGTGKDIITFTAPGMSKEAWEERMARLFEWLEGPRTKVK